MNFGTRREELERILKSDRKTVLYVVEDVKSAQFRYRCRNAMDAVLGGDDFGVVWFLKSEIERIDLVGVDLVVIERQTDKDGAVSRFINKAHKIGLKVVMDLDDLIFDYRDLLLLMRSTNSRNLFYWAGYFWGIRRIAKKVDGFICTNEFLAGKLGRSFGKPVAVMPNSLNREQVEISDKCIAEGKKGDSGFMVGYFSGSPTHKKDFDLVEKELVCFLKAHEDVSLLVVGYMEFSDEMRRMIDAKRVKVRKLVDYLKLQELMFAVDVNIAPLVINDFTNCKSELKFFEAAAVETTTIASPTYAFKKSVSDKKNGFLARPGEWYDELEYLYQHSDENRKIALAARKYAMKYYYGKEFLRKVEMVYGYFTK